VEAPQKADDGGNSDEEMEEQEAPAAGKQSKAPKKGKALAGSGDEQQQDKEGERPQMVERVLGESKKDATVRRRELLGSGPDSLGGSLVAEVAGRAGGLLRDQWGCDVVVEVARGATGGLLWECQREGVEAVHDAIIEEVLASSSNQQQQQQQQQPKKQQSKKRKGGDEEQQQQQQQQGDGGAAGKDGGPLLTHYFANRALRRLLIAAAEDGPSGDGARAFARALWSRALQGKCKQWVGGHADKVLAALVVCGEPEVASQAAAELGPLVGGSAAAWAATHGGGGPGAAGAAAAGAGKAAAAAAGGKGSSGKAKARRTDK